MPIFVVTPGDIMGLALGAIVGVLVVGKLMILGVRQLFGMD